MKSSNPLYTYNIQDNDYIVVNEDLSFTRICPLCGKSTMYKLRKKAEYNRRRMCTKCHTNYLLSEVLDDYLQQFKK